MKRSELNLARRPFVNRRPVQRSAALLWTVVLVLTAVNAVNYWRHFSGSEEQQVELQRLRESLAAETAARDAALARLDAHDLDWQRNQIEFLNARIAERTFAWSELFDHLAEVLPPTVRLARLTPRVTSRRDGSRGRTASRRAEDAVLLSLTGYSEDDAVLLELVDGFYRHPRFRRPDLQIESRNDAGTQVEFSMTVLYTPETEPRPGGESPTPAAEGDGGPAGATPDDGDAGADEVASPAAEAAS